MHVFSYVLLIDDGNAPNPYGGILTLAICKPRIRRVAQVGDYIVGTGSVNRVGKERMIYAARISQVIPFEDYGRGPKFHMKRPSETGKDWQRYGDNIYFREGNRWKQRTNAFHDISAMEHDLSGVNVLVCSQFWYFGREAVTIPLRFRSIIKAGRGHKRIRDERLVRQVTDWLSTLPPGIHGEPDRQLEERASCSRRCTPMSNRKLGHHRGRNSGSC